MHVAVHIGSAQRVRLAFAHQHSAVRRRQRQPAVLRLRLVEADVLGELRQVLLPLVLQRARVPLGWSAASCSDLQFSAAIDAVSELTWPTTPVTCWFNPRRLLRNLARRAVEVRRQRCAAALSTPCRTELSDGLACSCSAS